MFLFPAKVSITSPNVILALPTRIFAKRIVNSYIRSFGFKTTRFFNDISQPEINQSLDNIEIMCHPFLKNGIVVDAFRGIQINKQEDNIVNYNKI